MIRSRLLLLLPLLNVAFAAGCSKSDRASITLEAEQRQARAHGLSADAGSSSSWNVSCSDDIIYDDGFTLIEHDRKDTSGNSAFRWMGQRGTVRLKSHGGRPMRLFTYGWANIKALQTTPTLTAYIDGRMVGTTTPPPETGLWGIDTVVPKEFLEGRDWVELVITTSTIAWPWADVAKLADAPTLAVIALNFMSWTDPP